MGYLKSFNSVILNEAKIAINPLNGNLKDSDLSEIGEGRHKLNPEAAADYKRMKAIANAEGVNWGITDSYRRYEIQNSIFDWDRFNKTGERRKKGTNIAAAYPGTSNHGYGSAVDLIVKQGDPAHTWLTNNAQKFGFSPLAGEPWHWDHKGSAAKLGTGKTVQVADSAISISKLVKEKNPLLASKLELFEIGNLIITDQAKSADDVILFIKSYLPEEYKKMLGELEVKSPLYSKEFTQVISKFQNDKGLPRVDGAFDISTYNELFKNMTQKSGSVDAVLIGGLDTRPGDLNIDKQVELLKKGYGNKNIKGFRYNTSSEEIIKFLEQNPKIPVFMFSAGAQKALDLVTSQFVDANKLFVIEPYAASEGVKNLIVKAVNRGIKSEHVFVGPDAYRGKGIVPGEKSSGVDKEGHWAALTKVGETMSKVV